MQLKNSFRQLVRTPVKTALFVVFISFVTAFLCFGTNMQLSVKQSLEQADASFTTIGVVEHQQELPPGTSSSNFCFPDTQCNYSPIIESPHVLQFDQRQFFTAHCPDILVSNEAYRPGNTFSILIFEALPQGRGRVVDLLFDRGNYSLGDNVQLRKNIDQDFVIDIGKQYIASFQSGGYDKIEVVTDEDYLDTSAGQVWKEQVEELNNSLHNFGVYSTNDIQSMLAFHQGNAVLGQGRFFSQEEYQSGEQVCIISAAMAEHNNLEIGDYISLNLYSTNGRWTNLGHDAGPLEVSADIIDSGSFEIIGTYMELDNMGPDYGIPEQIIFIPQESILRQPSIISSVNFVSFRLQNGSAQDFMVEIEEHLPEMSLLPDVDTVAIDIYDQGYSKISGALNSMRSTALLLTVVGAAVGLVLIVLLGNLYVGRQLRTVAVMYSLGVSRRKCLAFLMLGVLLLVGTAAILGATTGFVLSNSTMADIYASSLETAEIDLAYSDIYGAQEDVAYDLILPQPWLAPMLAILVMLLASLAVSWAYAAKILKAEPMQVMMAKEE